MELPHKNIIDYPHLFLKALLKRWRKEAEIKSFKLSVLLAKSRMIAAPNTENWANNGVKCSAAAHEQERNSTGVFHCIGSYVQWLEVVISLCWLREY